MTYSLTRAALHDLASIETYLVHEASKETAERIEAELFAAFDDLTRLPPVGHRRLDVPRSDLLFHVVNPYLIAFRRQREQVTIIRVLHGRRDVPRLLR